MIKYFIFLVLIIFGSSLHLFGPARDVRVRINALTRVTDIGRGFVLVDHAKNGNNNKGPFFEQYVFDAREFHSHIREKKKVYVIHASCVERKPWKDWVGEKTLKCVIVKVKS